MRGMLLKCQIHVMVRKRTLNFAMLRSDGPLPKLLVTNCQFIDLRLSIPKLIALNRAPVRVDAHGSSGVRKLLFVRTSPVSRVRTAHKFNERFRFVHISNDIWLCPTQ